MIWNLRAQKCAPIIGDILRDLRAIPGVLASLTGSGSALFALSVEKDFSTEQISEVESMAKRYICELFDVINWIHRLLMNRPLLLISS